MSNVYKIAIIGETGHGKSTFGTIILQGQANPQNPIFKISANTQYTAGTLKAEISPVCHFYGKNSLSQVQVIDTCGFNDPSKPDAECMKDFLKVFKEAEEIHCLVIMCNFFTKKFTRSITTSLDLLLKAFPKSNILNQVVLVYSEAPQCDKKRKTKDNLTKLIAQHIGTDTIPSFFIDAENLDSSQLDQFYALVTNYPPVYTTSKGADLLVSMNMSTVMFCSMYDKVCIVDPSTGSVLKKLDAHEKEITHMHVHENWLATVSNYQMLIWKWAKGNLEIHKKIALPGVKHLVFNKDTFIVANDSNIYYYTLGKESCDSYEFFVPIVSHVCLCDGKKILISYNPSGGYPAGFYSFFRSRILFNTPQFNSSSLLPNNEIALGCTNGTIVLYNSNQQLSRHNQPVIQLMHNSTLNCLLSLDSSGVLIMWKEKFYIPKDLITNVSFFTTWNQFIAVSSNKYGIKIYKFEDDELTEECTIPDLQVISNTNIMVTMQTE